MSWKEANLIHFARLIIRILKNHVISSYYSIIEDEK